MIIISLKIARFLPFVNGKREGLHTRWYKNGQKLEETNYVDGKKEELSIKWSDTGQKLEEINYVNGKEVSYKEWDEDGKCIEGCD